MERREVAALLAYAGRCDPRTMRTSTAEARDQIDQWHELLGDVPLSTADNEWDARRVIKAHALSSPYPVLPADVGREWHTYRRARIAVHCDPTPAADPDDPAAWRAELLGTRHAVMSGAASPATQREITSGGPHPDLADRIAAIGSCIPPAVRSQLAPFRTVRAAREAAVAEGRPDPLSVPCPCEWCRAPAGKPCRNRRADRHGAARSNAPRPPHPTRVDVAAMALARQEHAA
ncbi:zinc finger domain-containing protein [Streptomyces sp. NPDC002104]